MNLHGKYFYPSFTDLLLSPNYSLEEGNNRYFAL